MGGGFTGGMGGWVSRYTSRWPPAGLVTLQGGHQQVTRRSHGVVSPSHTVILQISLFGFGTPSDLFSSALSPNGFKKKKNGPPLVTCTMIFRTCFSSTPTRVCYFVQRITEDVRHDITRCRAVVVNVNNETVDRLSENSYSSRFDVVYVLCFYVF
jgi:hypothetical protein